jgi:serine protease Do
MRAFVYVLSGAAVTTLALTWAPARGQVQPVGAAGLASEAGDRARRRSPVVEVFEKCRDAVVNVAVSRTERYPRMTFEDIFEFGGPRVAEREVQSVGSGFVVHESGYVVTNAHVVAQGPKSRVIFAGGNSLEARLVAADPQHDLAVLKVDSPKPLPALRLGRSSDIMIGETVVAIGNPLGLQHSVTTGIVSALNRELRFSEQRVYEGLIQTDAAINPGNSGGPLLNINAELIGINTAIRGDAQNVGFAIPVDSLWELLPNLLDIELQQRVKFGLRVSGSDTRVLTVRSDSPAQKAGLRSGDRVVSFNNARLRDGIDYYVHLLNHKPGDEIRLTLEREGRQISTQVPLVAIPPPDGTKLAAAVLGLQISEIPRSVRRKLDLPDDWTIRVDDVINDSPAGRKLVDGDLILHVNRVPVQSLADVGMALENVSPGDSVVLDIVRLSPSGGGQRGPVTMRAR